MVVLNKIYTKTGDAGETALSSGIRVPKTHPLIGALGALDEANSALGLARSFLVNNPLDQAIARIQNTLFDLGAELANVLSNPNPRLNAEDTKQLEDEIDKMNASLEPLISFILPGGTPEAAYLHVARTVTRRAECALWGLIHDGTKIHAESARYLNRLSDWCFVAARIANNHGKSDILWAPRPHPHET